MHNQEQLQQQLSNLFDKKDYAGYSGTAFVWVEYAAEKYASYIGSYKHVSKAKLETHKYTLICVDDKVGIRIDDYIDKEWPDICMPLSLI